MRYRHAHKNPRKIPVALIVLVVLLLTVAAVGAGVFSKYKESVQLGNVDFTVASGALADEFTLQEHEAVQSKDGSYSLGTNLVSSNRYEALPGVTLPKNPFITIKGKSKVDSYLYVEVVDGVSSAGITYAMDSKWKKLDISGDNGGTVYVYTTDGTNEMIFDETFADGSIKILENDQITVSKTNTRTTNVSLDFYGLLAPVSVADTVEGVYTQITDLGGGN